MVASISAQPDGCEADSGEDSVVNPRSSGPNAPDLARALSGRGQPTYGDDPQDQFADLIAADLTDVLLRPVWLHAVSAGVALIVTALLWTECGPAAALPWIGLGAFAYGSRYLVVRLYRRFAGRQGSTRADDAGRWIRRYYPCAILLGLFWGSLPLVVALSPASSADGSAAVILFVAAWMMAGGVMTHAVRMDAVDAFLWPAATLVAVGSLLWPPWPYRAIPILALAYAFMLRLLSQRLNAASTGALRGQYEKAALAEQLSEANMEVREASRAKSEFLANMSHELRTPLNAIIGFSEIMAREILGPVGQARYRDYANDIQDSGKHLLGVINDILDLSRVEAGRMTLLEDEVDLASVIGGCVRLLSHRAATAGVAITVDFQAETPRICADEGRIRQIGFNLLANAIKFTPQGGEVTISVAPNDDGEVEFTVKDTGIGMRPEDIPIALTPFQQVQTGGVRNQGGTGLGLPLTKTLVELHGGRLVISSQLGQGTTVCAIFPLERVLPRKS
jgi:two-component system cell cycle sensor histidine kinase PleC